MLRAQPHSTSPAAGDEPRGDYVPGEIARALSRVNGPALVPPLEEIEPASALPADPAGAEQAVRYARARTAGAEALADGAVGLVTLAGGQGSRLGFAGPKGAYPLGPVSGACLFELQAGGLRRLAARHGASVPWYVMTSTATDAATRALFEQRGHFGLPAEQLRIFAQGEMPVVTADGARVVRTVDGRVATAPDGHGGLIAALSGTGCLADGRRRGLRCLSVIQIDNPLVRPVDPLLVGLHLEQSSELSLKVLEKAHDLERVGSLCQHRGRLRCIEYSDLPARYAHARRGGGGERLLSLGHPSIYLFDLGFLELLAADEVALPWHRAIKQVRQLSPETGEPITAPALKLERFLFDVLPRAERTLLLRTSRAEEFSPVKNASGEDSVQSARRDMTRRACRWLAAAGVGLPLGWTREQPACEVEIAPAFADSAADLRARGAQGLLPRRVEAGQRLVIGAEETR